MIDRRRFLRNCASTLALASASPFLLSESSAQVKVETDNNGFPLSLAGGIGKGLASGVLGAVGSAAFGQVLGSFGVDLSGQAAINQKLDRILAQLDELQKSVGQLQASMEQHFAELDYNTQFGDVRPLIDRNLELTRQFKLLLTASPDDVPGLKSKISDKLFDADFLSGMQTWKGALLGYDSGTSSGMIRGWNRAVYLRPSKLFTPADALAIQGHWDYFDAQQAMTVNFLVEQLNLIRELSPEGKKRQARALLDEWQANRAAQLQMLRGNAYERDNFPQLNGNQLEYSHTRLMALPGHCVVDKTSRLMWYQRLSTPVALTTHHVDFFSNFRFFAHNASCGLTSCSHEDTWRMPTEDELAQLTIRLGGSWDGDLHFVRTLKQAGFQGETPQYFNDGAKVWLDMEPERDAHSHNMAYGLVYGTMYGIGKPNYSKYLKCLPNYTGPEPDYYGTLCQQSRQIAPAEEYATDGTTNMRLARNAGDSGLFILVRELDPGEAYWG